MKVILIILFVAFLFSCKERRKKNVPVDAGKEEVINVKTKKIRESISQDTTSTGSKTVHSTYNNLTTYSYPNLTIWGGLTLKYDANNLRIIEAKQNAELGFRKKEYYIEDGDIVKVEYVIHQADWGAYEEKYGKEDFDESKMTYSDRNITYSLYDIQTKKSDELEQLLSTGKQILNFIKTEKIDAYNTK
ncbi:hypothetical protein [Fluviicola taffensis]|uniref:hypothetical protein n=1 Tax=Fluviicola taffensis TaxID=191579 RepID=UPI0031384978